MGRKNKRLKIPKTIHPTFGVGSRGRGLDYWTKQATTLNRELGKTHSNGKTEYVAPHVRRKKDGTPYDVGGYFRQPPPRSVPKREVGERESE